MAAPALAVAAKKTATIILTDKRTWTAIVSIIAGVLMLLILPAIALTSALGSVDASQVDMQRIIENMPPEQRVKMQYFETVMNKIAEEIKEQNLNVDPAKAQIIYLCALPGKEKESETFYKDYVNCFKDTQNDDQIFENITRKFGIVFTDSDKEKIIQLYNAVVSSPSGGDFLSPFHGVNYKDHITSPFGYRTDPITGEQRYHSGVDISMLLGTPIYAVKDGTVQYVGYDANGYGNYVMINHGDKLVTLYGHCSAILVTAGQKVTTNTIIAKVGSTGRSTGPHLHLEVIVNGEKKNPLDYLK